MPGWTCKDIADDVRRQVDDPSVSDTDILRWIHRGLMDLASVLRVEDTTTIAVQPGTGTYPLPADLMEIRKVRLDGAGTFLDLLRDLEDTDSTGYREWAGQITLQPTPEEADTLTIWYWREPALPATIDDEPVDVPQRHRQALVWYCSSMYEVGEDESELDRASHWPRYLAAKATIAAESSRRVARSRPAAWKVVR